MASGTYTYKKKKKNTLFSSLLVCYDDRYFESKQCFLILRDMDTLIFDQDKKNLKICRLLHFSRHGYSDFGSRSQDLNVVAVIRRGDRVVKVMDC
ncbi:hypothetical protein OUZ56_024672 [Daphnia magna]|uniref:Uncharacterized protein n=1 Tax=Daphnia magna TaxID=35525 RepID=A0ABR0B167_9CRUS|nr:hypothetical protein OUZ56_024672 [Daphnia magna]